MPTNISYVSHNYTFGILRDTFGIHIYIYVYIYISLIEDDYLKNGIDVSFPELNQWYVITVMSETTYLINLIEHGVLNYN